MDDAPLEFDCAIRQIKSMADHSYNVTLNLPEYCIKQVAEMLDHIEDFARVVVVFEDSVVARSKQDGNTRRKG